MNESSWTSLKFVKIVSQMSTNFQQSTFKNLKSEHGILSFLDSVLLLKIVQNHNI